jgi:hypothetical protein
MAHCSASLVLFSFWSAKVFRRSQHTFEALDGSEQRKHADPEH